MLILLLRAEEEVVNYCNIIQWLRCCIVDDSGTLEDTELVDGLVFSQKTAGAGGPKRVEKAKIGLIQFCISPPKTDVCCTNVLVLSVFVSYSLLKYGTEICSLLSYQPASH